MTDETIDATPSAPKLQIESWVREALRCPATGTPLREQLGPDGSLELVNTDAGTPLAYPVRDGVPVLLVAEARSI